MSDHVGHPPGCYTSIGVRFAPDSAEPPAPIALAVGAIAGLLAECAKDRTAPEGLINIAVGPSGDLTGLWAKLSKTDPLRPATVAAADQINASFRAEPRRFAALAFAHVVPVDPA